MKAFLKLFAGRPFLAVSLALVLTTLWYREQYNDEIKAGLKLAAQQTTAEIEARELAQERQYQFMTQELERLDQEREATARMKGLEQAALIEVARINEAADELVQAKFTQIEELNAEYECLSARVPDDAVRLFEPAQADNRDSPRVYPGAGPR